MDKTNYAWYIPVYHVQMIQLKETCPVFIIIFKGVAFLFSSDMQIYLVELVLTKSWRRLIKDTQTTGGT